MRILTLTSMVRGGGAEGMALAIAKALAAEGHRSHVRVMVGQPNDPPLVSATPFSYDAMPFFQRARCYVRSKFQIAGVEQCASESSRHLFDALPFEPEIIHCHNIRVDLVRIEDLAKIVRKAPVVWTMHDMWPLTGHCTHAFECGRWKTGCGQCPHLDVPVELKHDFSRVNLWRRRRIYNAIARRDASRLCLVSPSRWLAEIARRSVAGCLPVEHIPNGVDTDIFCPVDGERRSALREKLGIPAGKFVVLFAGHWGSRNPFKDFATFAEAARSLAHDPSIHFACVGNEEEGSPGGEPLNLTHLGALAWPHAMAEAYQAADLYVHATRADNMPLTVLEALACGLPVVGTRIGGVPEEIEEGETGFLTEPGDAAQLADRIRLLSQRHELHGQMRERARDRAVSLFDQKLMIQRYEALYERMLGPRS